MKMNMANQCLNMGQLDQAEVLYRQVLADDPDHLIAMRALVGLYESQDKHHQTISLLRKMVELTPEDVEPTLRLAEQLNALE